MLAEQLYLIFHTYILLLEGLQIKINNQTTYHFHCSHPGPCHHHVLSGLLQQPHNQLIASTLVLLQTIPKTAARIFLLNYQVMSLLVTKPFHGSSCQLESKSLQKPNKGLLISVSPLPLTWLPFLHLIGSMLFYLTMPVIVPLQSHSSTYCYFSQESPSRERHTHGLVPPFLQILLQQLRPSLNSPFYTATLLPTSTVPISLHWFILCHSMYYQL